jgi:uncharacterized membrane protein YraQ (UPF0718 family)
MKTIYPLEAKMSFILDLIIETGGQVWQTLLHNWPFLLVSALLAAVLKLYLDPGQVSAFLLRHQKAGVVGATAAAVATPLCSCGTTAVLLGMLANTMPWAPIVAFMVASPLTSPQELVYSAGLFGWRFALAFFGASIFLGLAGGVVAWLFDRRGWLLNQTRQILQTSETGLEPIPASFRPDLAPASTSIYSQPIVLPVLEPAGCACQAVESSRVPLLSEAGAYVPGAACCLSSAAPACGCDIPIASPSRRNFSLALFLRESYNTGWRLLVLFLAFAFIGYFLNGLIPSAWVAAIFGRGNAYSVPLAAFLGLPLYVNTEASLPLVRTMLEAGMSEGAALAFLITGAGTSIGAVTGILTIARWRVVGLVVAILWVGAVLAGLLYNLAF